YVVTNGIGDRTGKKANGGHCLAAQIVPHFKHGKTRDDAAAGEMVVGNFYLYPAGTRDAGEDCTYHITPIVGGAIVMRVETEVYGQPANPRPLAVVQAEAVVQGLADTDRGTYTFIAFDGPVEAFDASAVENIVSAEHAAAA